LTNNGDKKNSGKFKQPRFTQFVPELKNKEKSPYYIDLKPVVKWAGGKRGLIDKYKKFFPKDFKNYYEPFFGGGAVFFYFYSLGSITSAKLSDINEELINLYNVVKSEVEDLIQELSNTAKYKNDRKIFEKRRSEEPKDSVERAARMIYLNRTCYNGLYRVNKQGKFNVPFGRYPDNIQILNSENLRNVSQCFQNVEITAEDFEESVKDAKKKDFVYFDPPYIPLTDTAYFTDYTSEGFGIKEQERLARVFKELDERGCYVMESNSDVQKISELYKGYKIKKREY